MGPMDPFSQAGLGAITAQVVGHRQLGFKAALLGAGAGALPDIDVLFSITGDFVDQLITHRGITHSLFFAPVIGPLLGWLIWYRERKRNPALGLQRRNCWMIAMTLAVLSHPLLDWLTPYGTQLLLPFSNARFAINAMPIIDPIYTMLLGLGLLSAWMFGRLKPDRVRLIAVATLLLSSSYLGYGWLQNATAERAAAEQLAASGIKVDRVAAFPTILQVHLRRVVARSPQLDLVGFYSTWSPCEIVWSTAARADPADYRKFLTTRGGAVFDWFTMGWAHYQLQPDSLGQRLEVSDLRYGYSEDPLRSVFMLNAILDQQGEITHPATAARSLPGESPSGQVVDPGTAVELALEQLIRNAYAPACRLHSASIIPSSIPHNGILPPHRERPS